MVFAQSAQDHAHALLHLQQASHEHHDDGTVSRSDSVEAAQHLLVDEALGAPALCLDSPDWTPSLTAARAARWAPHRPPAPSPFRLERPPRATA